MKGISILFLQAVVVLVGILSLFILIRFPLTEGRAVNLDLWSIYTDPFIIYAYASSLAFFIGLYQVIRLLGCIGQNNLYSSSALRTLRRIKYCAIALSALIVMAAIYIRIFHPEDDDPAGFLALSIIATIISVAVATAVAVLEKILRHAVDMKSENDLTI
ncbi:MAG: DUF2975 domain-containing protein [Cyclobacteriaceae bacterium]